LVFLLREVVCSCQILSGRVPKTDFCRHYLGKKGGKPQFEYHPQTLEYLQRKLGEMKEDKSNNQSEVGQIGHVSSLSNFDLEKTNLSSFSKNEAGPMGFEPMTFSLEG
jgi:hypothetical protein